MQDPDILPQQARENPDPHEDGAPVPWGMIVLTGILLAFGAAYIATSDIAQPSSWGDGREANELRAQAGSAGGKVDGGAIYASLCMACHQANGQGLPGVFPPLAQSEWVVGREDTAAAILLHGVSGPLTVKGVPYNGAMPAFGGQLDDEQVAAVLTHIRSQWGNDAPALSADAVARAREEHKARTTPFAGEKDLPPHG